MKLIHAQNVFVTIKKRKQYVHLVICSEQQQTFVWIESLLRRVAELQRY